MRKHQKFAVVRIAFLRKRNLGCVLIVDSRKKHWIFGNVPHFWQRANCFDEKERCSKTLLLKSTYFRSVRVNLIDDVLAAGVTHSLHTVGRDDDEKGENNQER